MLCSVNKQDIMSFRNLIKTLTDEELYNFTEVDFDFYLLVEELFIQQEELQKNNFCTSFDFRQKMATQAFCNIAAFILDAKGTF
jgi:hypothetical protein